MPPKVDFEALRARIGNLQARHLERAAADLGWVRLKGRGKGSHSVMGKGSRKIVIPRKRKRGTFAAIIDLLEEESRRGSSSETGADR